MPSYAKDLPDKSDLDSFPQCTKPKLGQSYDDDYTKVEGIQILLENSSG